MNKLVTFSGSEGYSSKTSALRNIIAQKAVNRYGFELQQYDMSNLGASFGLARTINDLEKEGQAVVSAIEAADALVIATPVYKGSYPGLFKHFIDLLDVDIFYGKPIILAATGGGTRHALVVEHQLRPLLGFFMAHSLPTAIYASTEDYSAENKLVSRELLARIDQAVAEFSPFIQIEKEPPNTAFNLLDDQVLKLKSISHLNREIQGEEQ